MHVERGLTLETASGKFEKIKISLDRDDLALLLAQHAPGILVQDLRVHEAFQLLEGEIHCLLMATEASRLGTEAEAAQKIKAASAARMFILERIVEGVKNGERARPQSTD